MLCQNCNSEHSSNYGSGRFCSSKCARSYSTKIKRTEINKKVSVALKGKPSGQLGKRKPLSVEGLAKRKETMNKLSKQRCLTLPFDQVPTTRQKERILFEQNGKCDICSMLPFWNGKPLVFQLDNINGKQFGDHRENLRVICPNCHTQTTTFASKNVSPEGRKKLAWRKRQPLSESN